MPELADIDAWLSEAGPWLLPLIGLATLVEYLVPPFPGDTVTLVGTALAVRGTISPLSLLFVTSLGSIAGSVANYGFGLWVKRRLDSGKPMPFRRFLPQKALLRLEQAYRRWGFWLVLGNRFLPVARAVFFVFAGLSAMPFVKTIALGLVSALLWNSLLIGAGYALGANLDTLALFARRVGLAGALVALGVGLVAGVYFWRRRRQKNL